MKILVKEIVTGRGRISYRTTAGTGQVALVFIHGLGGDSKLFHKQLRHFSDRYRVVAVDLPGHGRSDWNALPSQDDNVFSLLEVIRHEALSDLVLLGHSMGGGVCFDLYSRMPGKIRAMVLISTGAVLPVARELFLMLERDVESFIDYFVTATFSQNAALLASFAKSGFNQGDRDIIRNDLLICQSMDYSSMLSDIDIPVLILANRGDRVVPTHITSYLKDRIMNSRYVEFDADGHIPHFDHKDLFNAQVESFLRDLLSPGVASSCCGNH
jgi:pimeloyl-ACP methyl ester carboxylesterase